MKNNNFIREISKRASGFLMAVSLSGSLMYAQGPRPSEPAPAIESGIVRGMVHDSTTNGSIEYATVGL